jgi:DNA polymerase delta subunit 1
VREASRCDFVIPEMRNSGTGSDDQYSGAFVLPPQSGMYQEPIATLDFASLYPSIIQVTHSDKPDDIVPRVRNRSFAT